MLLWFECLLVKLQLTKFWKFTIGHFKKFTVNITNPMKNFFKLIRTFLSTKSIYYFSLQKRFIKSLSPLTQSLCSIVLIHIPYTLRKGSRLLISLAKSVNFGTNSITFRGSLLWNNLPLRLKNSQTTDDFKFGLNSLGKIHYTWTIYH